MDIYLQLSNKMSTDKNEIERLNKIIKYNDKIIKYNDEVIKDLKLQLEAEKKKRKEKEPVK